MHSESLLQFPSPMPHCRPLLLLQHEAPPTHLLSGDVAHLCSVAFTRAVRVSSLRWNSCGLLREAEAGEEEKARRATRARERKSLILMLLLEETVCVCSVLEMRGGKGHKEEVECPSKIVAEKSGNKEAEPGWRMPGIRYGNCFSGRPFFGSDCVRLRSRR